MTRHEGELWWDEENGPMVRPYALTRGRTRPTRPDLDVVTQLVTERRAESSGLGVEHREILELCVRPLSVAEVAAYLDTPIVVVKVLASDLIERGYLVTGARPRPTRPDRKLLQAVLEGVRRL
ncbi:hypothetical protein GCM10011581_12070 [Saccharopolyspora subtropica]|uniref:DUF742 domain-containing protein n=1 Tax=Saccharopolyspora thermophila TaxID=89367 RepID=A0A917JN73_9PSEU|nr:DUF742 domain-containing protein [Saccharopolyspora subtropica]GGI76567.1 hypothetical protein GCM10011581_12070 [Saccharopolyspora subtropica]